MRPTLIFVRHTEINGRAYRHGDELPSDLLSQETIARLIDQGRIKEQPRRSLYRLLHHFSGCSETEPLDDELTSYSLRE